MPPFDSAPERRSALQGNEFKDNVVPIRPEFEEPHKPLSGTYAESMAMLKDMGYDSFQAADEDKARLEQKIDETRLSFGKKFLDKVANQGEKVKEFTDLEAKHHRLSRLLRTTKITAAREGVSLDEIVEVPEIETKDNVIEFPKAA